MIDNKQLNKQLLNLKKAKGTHYANAKEIIIKLLNHCVAKQLVFVKDKPNSYTYEDKYYSIRLYECDNSYNVYVQRFKDDFYMLVPKIELEEITFFVEYLKSTVHQEDIFFENMFDDLEILDRQADKIKIDKIKFIIDFFKNCMTNKIVFTKMRINHSGKVYRYSYQNDEYNIKIYVSKHLSGEVLVSIENNINPDFNFYEGLEGYHVLFFMDYLNKTAIEESKNDRY